MIGFHPTLIIKKPYADFLLGLPGIYLGFSIGILVLNILYLYMFITLDWKAQAQKILIELNTVASLPKPYVPNYSFQNNNDGTAHLLTQQEPDEFAALLPHISAYPLHDTR